jgi:hypothetical protein
LNVLCRLTVEMVYLSSFVIASQRVRAKRGPMTGSAKQSIAPQVEIWIASSLRSSQ